jgi:hypothetical protein
MKWRTEELPGLFLNVVSRYTLRMKRPVDYGAVKIFKEEEDCGTTAEMRL